MATVERLREVLTDIAADAESDVAEFEGKPFTGASVAELYGRQAAAIAALAKVVKELLPDEGSTSRPRCSCPGLGVNPDCLLHGRDD